MLNRQSTNPSLFDTVTSSSTQAVPGGTDVYSAQFMMENDIVGLTVIEASP